MTPRLALFGAALAAAVLLVASAPAAKPPDSLTLIEKGLDAAVAAGELSPDEATAYAATAKSTAAELKTLPPARADTLRGTLQDTAAQWRRYVRPRALTLFSTLEVNQRELASRPLPSSGADATDENGVVYRFFTGHGYVFHPLANFARLNVLVVADDPRAEALAAALAARAVPSQGGLVWEYLFPFGRGRPPWISGMAQAVAAQAFARAGDRLSDPALLELADAAYATIPGRLVRGLSAGPWIKLYSFDATPVLNAQLQTAISLGDYAEIEDSSDAAALVARLQAAAAALLPRFDTGYWTLYSLSGGESPLSYHQYVVTLLEKLANRTGDGTWKVAADRFAGYETQPPIVRLGKVTPTLYPVPADGYLDEAKVPFWLSKQSRVTLKAGGKVQSLVLGRRVAHPRLRTRSPCPRHPPPRPRRGRPRRQSDAGGAAAGRAETRPRSTRSRRRGREPEHHLVDVE